MMRAAICFRVVLCVTVLLSASSCSIFSGTHVDPPDYVIHDPPFVLDEIKPEVAPGSTTIHFAISGRITENGWKFCGFKEVWGKCDEKLQHIYLRPVLKESESAEPAHFKCNETVHASFSIFHSGPKPSRFFIRVGSDINHRDFAFAEGRIVEEK